MEIKARNKKIDEDEFMKMRIEVLSEWPTGREVDLEEAIEYQKKLPEHKNFSRVVERLHNEGRTVVFPRAGTPILEEEIELVRTLVEVGVPLIPVTSDSYTRETRYAKVEKILEESIRTGKPLLNGYPLINHGVKNTRKVVESADGAFDPRLGHSCQKLGAEIAFASGMTGISASPTFHWSLYKKTQTLEECIQSSQYVFRLMGYYAERGVLLTTDLHGLLPGGVFPYSIALVGVIMDSLIAAEQGVKSIIPLVSGLGNTMEDIAIVRVARRLVREYLDRFSYKDVIVPGIIDGQIPLFPYPQGMGEAFAFLCYGAMVATLAGAEAAGNRTIDEGGGVPTKESHALSYRAAKWIFDVVREQKIELEEKEIAIEENILEMEIRAIIDKLLEIGDGDIAVGAIKGVELGIIDSPFSPNIHMKGNVLGVRDNKGVCRYLEFGNLPIPKEAKQFHRQKVAEREKAEGRKMDYHVVIEDLWAMSKGHIKGNPSFFHNQ